MRLHAIQERSRAGSVLMTALIIGGVIFVTIASMFSLSTTAVKSAHGRADWNSAFYHAENAMMWAAQNVLDSAPGAGSSNYYATANGTLPISYMLAELNGSMTNSGFKNAWVSVIQPTNALNDVYVITASARVDDKVRTLQATITAYPVSLVFDYEYFLNNWGWWWGSTITGNGAQRANWDFDFQGDPMVNGYIYAADKVESDEIPVTNLNAGTPFRGEAGADPLDLVHSGVPRVVMPNLLDFSNYTASALANTASNGLWLGATQIVFGVQSNAAQPGLYITGTTNQPITIKGTVVVPGDVVIQGPITGRGTLYVGGNLYIANDVTYANGPNFTTPPETMSPSNRDAWVAANANSDLVAYAVRGAIFAGDVTNPDWINWCYWFPGSGLAYVGDESHLGADGIAGTPDDNIPFLHPDGTWSTWYDADGDGKVEGNYNYSTDINMDNTRASKILNYPTDTNGNPVAYNQVATDQMGNLEGIFYTDHAAAMRLADNTATFHGVIVSRNEQIVFQEFLDLNYDSRVNSRYHNNPNQFVNLGLPYGVPIVANNFVELPPNLSNL